MPSKLGIVGHVTVWTVSAPLILSSAKPESTGRLL